MKTFLALLIAAMLCGCSHHTTSLEELETSADLKIRTWCSNNIVGINRIVRVEAFPPIGGNWVADGQADVDYINKVGGIERTNLPFKIKVIEDGEGQRHVDVDYDYKTQTDRWVSAMRRRLEAPAK